MPYILLAYLILITFKDGLTPQESIQKTKENHQTIFLFPKEK